MYYLYLLHLTLCYYSCYCLKYLEGWNYINLHCRDNNNMPVDWWYIYKPASQPDDMLLDGLNFTFITPYTEGRWEAANVHITGASMLQHTLSPVFRNSYQEHIAIMAYDDNRENHNSKGTAAHGLMLADELGGVWIGHSIPGLLDFKGRRITFPHTEAKKGHLLMCLSLELKTLNEIAGALKHMSPKVTERRVSSNMLPFLPNWNLMNTPSEYPVENGRIPMWFDFLSKGNLRGSLVVRQPGDRNCLYKTFASTQQIVLDVYGHDSLKKSICNKKYSLRNINAISLKFEESVHYILNRTDRIGFAISTGSHWQRRGAGPIQYWTCISGVEKEDSSQKGGFIVCVDDYRVWLSFDNLKIKEPEC